AGKLFENEPVARKVDIVDHRSPDSQASCVDQQAGLIPGSLPSDPLVERLRTVGLEVPFLEESGKAPPVDLAERGFGPAGDVRSFFRFWGHRKKDRPSPAGPKPRSARSTG